jgi:hypothetical protein
MAFVKSPYVGQREARWEAEAAEAEAAEAAKKQEQDEARRSLALLFLPSHADPMKRNQEKQPLLSGHTPHCACQR